jgi:hypothetical protein
MPNPNYYGHINKRWIYSALCPHAWWYHQEEVGQHFECYNMLLWKTYKPVTEHFHLQIVTHRASLVQYYIVIYIFSGHLNFNLFKWNYSTPIQWWKFYFYYKKADLRKIKSSCLNTGLWNSDTCHNLDLPKQAQSIFCTLKNDHDLNLKFNSTLRTLEFSRKISQ